MTAFELFAVLKMDSKEFDKGLDDAEQKSSKFGSAVKGAVAVGGAAIAATGAAAVAAGKSFVDSASDVAQYGDHIDKMSQKIGISAEAYQEWDAVLQHSGASIDSLQPAMKKMATEAQSGSDAFQKLGISQEEVATLSQEDLFSRVIEGLQGMEEGTERTTIASELLGRGATELGALLNTSAEDTQAMKDRVHELGGVMSDEAVKSAAAFQDTLQDMQTGLSGLKNNMMSEFLPSITTVMGGLTEIFSGDSDKGLAQVSKGIETMVGKMTEILPKVLKVGAEIVTGLAKAIVDNLPELMKSGVEIVTQLSTSIVTMLPDIVQAAIDVVGALVQGITDAIPTLIPAIVEAVMTIATVLTEPSNLSMILQAGLDLLMALVDAIVQSIPIIINALPQIIDNIIQFLIKAIPQLIQAGIKLFTALVNAMPQIISAIVKALPQIIKSIVDGLTKMLPDIIKMGITLFVALIKNLPKAIATIVAALPQVISSIVKGLTEGVPKILELGKKMIVTLAEGIKGKLSNVKNAVKEIVEKIKETIKEKVDAAKTWGKDLITNFVNGIKQKMSDVKNAFKKLGELIKSLIGFSEPEEGPLSNFHTFAPDMIDLFTKGIKDNEDKLKNQIASSFDFGNLGTFGAPTQVVYPQESSKTINITLELDKVALGRAVYKLNSDESKRVGVSLANV